MRCAQGHRGWQEVAGLCGGGIRAWDRRYSDPEVNIVFKINFVGAVPWISAGMWEI